MRLLAPKYAAPSGCQYVPPPRHLRSKIVMDETAVDKFAQQRDTATALAAVRRVHRDRCRALPPGVVGIAAAVAAPREAPAR
jgi:hypothetical protein